ncbi:MAG: 3,4-dihydroxy-2-butanone-4-phosphate synthase [Candidatus Micrarchaeota archaeon]
MGKVEQAVEQLAAGNFIVMYDGDEREGEADLIFHAAFATHDKIRKLRSEAGGLICLALGEAESAALKLPFYTDMLRKAGFPDIACKKTAYGDEPAFSLAVNHKQTFTGITDQDRAFTIREVDSCLRSGAPYENFVKNFYSPGHIFLLRSRGLAKRKGHTELATALAAKTGLPAAAVLCELLSTKKAMSKQEATNYAARNKLLFIEGKEVSEEMLK